MAEITNTTHETLITGTSADDTIENYGEKVIISTGSGNDSVYNCLPLYNLNGMLYHSKSVSINTGAGNDSVENWNSDYVTISTGVGNDYVANYAGHNTTINTGAGNDLISLSSTLYVDDDGSKENVIIYKSGDGNDKIRGFDDDDRLSIVGGSYSIAQSDKNIIVTVDDGKISLISAADYFSDDNIVFKQTVEQNTWKLNGTTATYGTSKKTLVKVTGVKSLDGISLSDKVVMVAASSLNKKKVSITGSGYTLALADDVTTPKTKKAAWAYKSGTATYKSSYKTAGYSLASNGKSITYSKATTAATLATINGARSKTGLSISGQKITLKNSALKNKVSVSGGYDFNFASDYKNAMINGSANADTITANGSNLSVNGGAGDDLIKIFGTTTTVTGGAGSDVFVFKAGSNVIADYAEEDLISIAGTAQVTTSGDDVIFSVGSSKLTVTGGADKEISYVDASGEQTYSATSPDVSISGKTIVLLEDYMEDSFNVADYGANLQTIDASPLFSLTLKLSATSSATA